MTTSIDVFKELYKENDFHYETVEGEDGIFDGVFTLDCKLQKFAIRYIFEKGYVLLLAHCPIKADKNTKKQVSEYLNRINWNLYMGSFVFNEDDGRIAFRMYLLEPGDAPVPKISLQDALAIIFRAYENFGDGIAALAMGFSDVETELKKAYEKNEAS